MKANMRGISIDIDITSMQNTTSDVGIWEVEFQLSGSTLW